MKRSEMIAFIKANPFTPITHTLFADNEFIYADELGDVWDENGNMFEDWYHPHMCDGIRIRTDDVWQDGWSVKKETLICRYHLTIPKVGLCCEAYYKSKGYKGLGQKRWTHFPTCSEENCPLKHPELLKGATLE